jgi:hypothetical protein
LYGLVLAIIRDAKAQKKLQAPQESAAHLLDEFLQKPD